MGTYKSRELFGVTKGYSLLIGVLVARVYTFVKIHQTVCELYLSKVSKRRAKSILLYPQRKFNTVRL